MAPPASCSTYRGCRALVGGRRPRWPRVSRRPTTGSSPTSVAPGSEGFGSGPGSHPEGAVPDDNQGLGSIWRYGTSMVLATIGRIEGSLASGLASLFTPLPRYAPRRSWELLWLLVILLVAAVARLWDLGSFSLHKPDEDTTVLAAVHIFQGGQIGRASCRERV